MTGVFEPVRAARALFELRYSEQLPLYTDDLTSSATPLLWPNTATGRTTGTRPPFPNQAVTSPSTLPRRTAPPVAATTPKGS